MGESTDANTISDILMHAPGPPKPTQHGQFRAEFLLPQPSVHLD